MNKIIMPTKEEALPGSDTSMRVPKEHYVHRGHSLQAPFPDNLECAVFGLGCFWGAERQFWLLQGVYSTAVGYAAGFTKNPSYDDVCSGMTGHNEVVLVVYDPSTISYLSLLKVFWESHNPTQGMQQGHDIGTQYRSGIYCKTDEQLTLAKQTQQAYQQSLNKAGHGEMTTEIVLAPVFYYAEHYHQQYLAKNPAGYCGLGGTGVCLA